MPDNCEAEAGPDEDEAEEVMENLKKTTAETQNHKEEKDLTQKISSAAKEPQEKTSGEEPMPVWAEALLHSMEKTSDALEIPANVKENRHVANWSRLVFGNLHHTRNLMAMMVSMHDCMKQMTDKKDVTS